MKQLWVLERKLYSSSTALHSPGLPAICKAPVFVMIAKSVPKPERNTHFIDNISGTFQNLRRRERASTLSGTQRLPREGCLGSAPLNAHPTCLHLVFSLPLTALNLSSVLLESHDSNPPHSGSHSHPPKFAFCFCFLLWYYKC